PSQYAVVDPDLACGPHFGAAKHDGKSRQRYEGFFMPEQASPRLIRNDTERDFQVSRILQKMFASRRYNISPAVEQPTLRSDHA
uniref:hypothetical protein n=1 Tax=Pseudomonas viridiflava TaxID=33069 RepID=UPI001982236C